MFSKILSYFAVKLLTEKVIVKLTISCAGYLVKKTTNTLDDKIFSTIEEALK